MKQKLCQSDMGTVEKLAARSSAPGQYLGFTLQSVRMTYHLLTAPAGCEVSVEYADDVAVHFPGGETLLEQTKSALSQNPVSDWAEDLWKTLANWTDTIASSGGSATNYRFTLYVTPPKTGKVVQRLNDLKSDTEILVFLSDLQKKLTNKKPTPSCASQMDKFLTAPTATQIAIIKNFSLQSVDTDPIDPIRTLLNAVLPDHAVEAMADFAIGSAQNIANEKLRTGTIAKTDVSSFRERFHAFVQKHDLSKLLLSISGPPSKEEIEKILNSSPKFIQQLQLVEMERDDCMRAISAFLQTSADKTDWAESGTVVPSSFDEYNNDLVQRYNFINSEVKDTQTALPPEARGRVVYNRCCQSSVKLESREVPIHFVCGCFNSLADELKLGWHPDYKLHFVKDGGC